MRKRVLCLAIAVCAVAAPASGSPGVKTHRVVLSRSWTPAVVKTITHRVDARRGMSVALVWRARNGQGGNAGRGWWLVSRDPTRANKAALFDGWVTEVLGLLYRDRRARSAPPLTGIALKSRAPAFEGWSYGELALSFPTRARRHFQARPAAFRAVLQRRAAKLGLKLTLFRAPPLGGILAPVVTLQVSNKERFARWYDPGCLPEWIFGQQIEHPDGSDGLSPYFAFFVTLRYASGDWLESQAEGAGETGTQLSARAEKRARKLGYRRLCRRAP